MALIDLTSLTSSTADQNQSERNFFTIPPDNIMDLPIMSHEMASFENETSSSVENACFSRGFSQQQNSDSLSAIPSMSGNVEKTSVVNWLNSKPKIFSLFYYIVFGLFLFLAIVLAYLNVKSWFFFRTFDIQTLEAYLPYMLATISAIIMALTGYARYRQLEYFLQCAAQKIKNQINILTFSGKFSDISSLMLLLLKIAKYKKLNKQLIDLSLFASLAQGIFLSICFGQFGTLYWESFGIYLTCILVYCFYMIKIINLTSHNFKYKSFSFATIAISIIGSISGICCVIILEFEILAKNNFFETLRTTPSTVNAIFELISNLFFPVFLFLTFLMYN